MQCERNLKLRSRNTSYCIIEVVTKARLIVLVLFHQSTKPNEKKKGRSNDLQSITHNIKNRAPRTPLKFGVNLSLQLYIFVSKENYFCFSLFEPWSYLISLFLLLSLGQHLCWRIITLRGSHRPSSRWFGTDMVY